MLESLKGYWSYRVVDRLRLEDPREAVRFASFAVHRAEPAMLPWLLGTVGSSLRRLGHLRPALDLFEEASNLARTLGDRRVLANLQQRIAHVYCDLGDNRAAIRHSDIGMRLFVQLEDKIGQGQSLVDLGKWHFHLQEFDETLGCNLAALRVLPQQEANHRFAALLGNAFCFEELGNLEATDRWSEIAYQHSEGVQPVILTALFWLRGKLSLRRGHYETAKKRFEAAHDFYVEGGFYLFAAATAIELCETLLLLGEPKQASRTAVASAELVQHLRDSRVARGVICTLSDHAAAGRPLSLKLLADLRRRLEDVKPTR